MIKMGTMIASLEMQAYFDSLQSETGKAYEVASQARAAGFDPERFVEVHLASCMAERVVGLISVLAPQVVNSGVVERITELEKQYGVLDWRVALKIAEEVALEKFCKFKDKKEALEIGIRAGFAYVTLGVVSSPLDGIVSINIKKRMDGRGEYFCISYAGPIRNAGGTAATVSLLIADYVRKCLGYDVYDAQPVEIKRAMTELQDYRDRVAPRQYFPAWEELEFLMSNLPVEVGGEPSEKIEVSNFKDLPRIPTNLIRSGFCLMMTECIPLKAPKIWKQLNIWGKSFGLEHWAFLEKFLQIQKKAKAQSEKVVETKIAPNYSYLSDLVAGRPVLGHPMRQGSFRLRYGRSRISGYSCQCISPATMAVLNNYLATGTQLKLERPCKATSLASCSQIDGPIVKLDDGSVVQLNTLEQVKAVQDRVVEILFLGDLLVSYGDFFNRAHPLVPVGYCPEWWAKELERATVELFGSLDFERLSELAEIPAQQLEKVITKPLATALSAETALVLAEKTKTPLHPAHTAHWSELTVEQFLLLLGWFEQAKTLANPYRKVLPNNNPGAKRALELLGVPHIVVAKDTVVVKGDPAVVLNHLLRSGIDRQALANCRDGLECINTVSTIKIRDKSGTVTGARMGRPEKAKMRKLTGSPHVLFPVGSEGGKFRSIQSALEAGKITADFPFYYCPACNSQTILSVCENCARPAQRQWHCVKCGLLQAEKCRHGPATPYKNQSIPIKPLFEATLHALGMTEYPELIKGVRGTSNKEHIPEHLAKGILRAKHDVYVNKDGTTRYDMTQLPVTHFRPCEIDTPLGKLKALGYAKDCFGKPLEREDQILELKPQDVILPNCDQSFDESADKILFRLAAFVDEELARLYRLKPYYNLGSEKDLVGQLVVCLAPHTSAGIIGRIIGFSRTQGFFAHPYLHAATRRDCDGDEACVLLLMDALLNFSRRYLPASRGGTMDAPLVLTPTIQPSEVDDMAFDLDIAWEYPLELYEAAQSFKMPWEVKIAQIKATLGTPAQYEGMGFTHDTDDLNATVRCSAYKTLPSMEEKLKGQMDIAEKIRAVDTTDVARLVIEKHFLKDTKGNLRKFSTQAFRCVNCNEKYRRPPLAGKCLKCNGRIIFTIAEGSIVKYLEPTISLAKKYAVSAYLQQTVHLLKMHIESVFGKEKEKQAGLGAWF